MGALTQLRAGTDPAAAEWNGKVRQHSVLLSPRSSSPSHRALLWCTCHRRPSSLAVAHKATQYMTCWARLHRNSPSADDEAKAKQLWEWLEEQVKDI